MTVEFPHAPYPAWAAIGVNWLNGFGFEIKVLARIPDAQALLPGASNRLWQG